MHNLSIILFVLIIFAILVDFLYSMILSKKIKTIINDIIEQEVKIAHYRSIKASKSSSKKVHRLLIAKQVNLDKVQSLKISDNRREFIKNKYPEFNKYI